jgi:hypothetical protein
MARNEEIEANRTPGSPEHGCSDLAIFFAARKVDQRGNHIETPFDRAPLMHGLQPALRGRFVATTDSNHDAPIFPDRARELAVVDGPNQLWVADLTYVCDRCRRSASVSDRWRPMPHPTSP